MFTLFRQRRINLNFKKSFLNYSFIILLEQRVDSLNLFTSEKKLAAIITFRFSKTLRQLKTFLKLIDWLRSFIFKYVQRANSLQQKKTNLIKKILKKSKNHSRKHQFDISFYESIEEKIRAFKNLQKTFFNPIFLIHFDFNRRLYIDLNAFKE